VRVRLEIIAAFPKSLSGWKTPIFSGRALPKIQPRRRCATKDGTELDGTFQMCRGPCGVTDKACGVQVAPFAASRYDAFGDIDITFRELGWKPPTFLGGEALLEPADIAKRVTLNFERAPVDAAC
jgi:hypothetical protein